jgi:hypothetical protein
LHARGVAPARPVRCKTSATRRTYPVRRLPGGLGARCGGPGRRRPSRRN